MSSTQYIANNCSQDELNELRGNLQHGDLTSVIESMSDTTLRTLISITAKFIEAKVERDTLQDNLDSIKYDLAENIIANDENLLETIEANEEQIIGECINRGYVDRTEDDIAEHLSFMDCSYSSILQNYIIDVVSEIRDQTIEDQNVSGR